MKEFQRSCLKEVEKIKENNVELKRAKECAEKELAIQIETNF